MLYNKYMELIIDLGIIFVIASIFGLIIKQLKLPLIVAYIIAGLVAGPLFLNLVQGGEEFYRTFAQFGIVLLLFIVGLSLNFNHIKKIGKPVLWGTFLQFGLTVFLGYFLNWSFALGFFPSLFL